MIVSWLEIITFCRLITVSILLNSSDWTTPNDSHSFGKSFAGNSMDSTDVFTGPGVKPVALVSGSTDSSMVNVVIK